MYQGVPLDSEAAPNSDAIGNKVCFSVMKEAVIPNHEEICPELCLRILETCTGKGATPCTFFRDCSLVRQCPIRSRRRIRYWCPWDATTIVERCEVEETEKGTRELRHSSPSGAFEHDAPRHNVHVTCHIIQVSVHQCRVYPLYFVIAPEQWNLSEAEESNETSGTNGNGVHHYLRKPRHAVTLEHQRP